MNRKEELFLVVIVIAVGFTIHYLISSILNLPDDATLLRGLYVTTKVDL
jgi:hypothetical protein